MMPSAQIRQFSLLQAKIYNIGRKSLRRRYCRTTALDETYPKKNLNKFNQTHEVHPYLLQDIEIAKSNHIHNADICIISAPQDFVYLPDIIKWHSRYAPSWQTFISLKDKFYTSALQFAITQHAKPKIFNVDHNAQFIYEKFITALVKHPTEISSAGEGGITDNILIDRFCPSPKQEIQIITPNTAAKVKNVIKNYINSHNAYNSSKNTNADSTIGKQTVDPQQSNAPLKVHAKTENANYNNILHLLNDLNINIVNDKEVTAKTDDELTAYYNSIYYVFLAIGIISAAALTSIAILKNQKLKTKIANDLKSAKVAAAPLTAEMAAHKALEGEVEASKELAEELGKEIITENGALEQVSETIMEEDGYSYWGHFMYAPQNP